MSGVDYSGERNCLISAGGLSGILNVLLATVEAGDEVIVTDPTYAGLLNRIRLAGGVPRFVPFVFTPGAELAARPRSAARRGRPEDARHAVDVALHALGRLPRSRGLGVGRGALRRS